jgi:hypothetical protein
LSFILSSLFEMNKILISLKVSASVGNDTDPYRLVKTYDNGVLGQEPKSKFYSK